MKKLDSIQSQHQSELDSIQSQHQSELDSIQSQHQSENHPGLKKLWSEIGFKMQVITSRQFNSLDLLFDEYGSDKGSSRSLGHVYSWPPHNYSVYYDQIFKDRKGHIKKVFECGLGSNNPKFESNMTALGKPGASLLAWRDYFPNATIIGGDIDVSTLLQEDRIRTAYLNQLDSNSIAEFWKIIDEDQFDLMIDDGLHTFEAGSTLFHASFDRIRNDGIYVIEDVIPNDLLKYREFFSKLPYKVEFISFAKFGQAFYDDTLLVIRK